MKAFAVSAVSVGISVVIAFAPETVVFASNCGLVVDCVCDNNRREAAIGNEVAVNFVEDGF